MTPDPDGQARFTLPAAFIHKMQSLLKEEFPAFHAVYQHPAAAALRVNPLKIQPYDFEKIAPFDLRPVAWCREGFWLESQPAAGKHPYHAAGLYYIQDASAMAAVELLDPQPGEIILDMAAAPGGKSTHILGRLQGDGILVANEIHPKRALELVENLERWGARNAIITCETPQRLAGRFPAYFDRILLDAPCSGEGMFRKSESARQDWSPALVQACATRQDHILEAAAAMLRPGGRLVYSTCTFSPEENEQVIARFLDHHPEFDLFGPGPGLEFTPGNVGWGGPSAPAALAYTRRMWPHLGMGEGHFIAALSKAAAPSPLRKRHPKPRGDQLHRNAAEIFREFSASYLAEAPDMNACILSGEHLYLQPPGCPELKGLHVLRPGLWLGEFKPRRFEPSHSLAMALVTSQAANHLEIDLDASRLYLHGHTLESPGSPGWVLITTGGFPLGWGKRVGTIVKNDYPKGLRWM